MRQLASTTTTRPPSRPFPLQVRKPEKLPKLYTFDEYLRREGKAVRKHEFFNGEIIPMAYAKYNHNVIAGNCVTALNIAIDKAEKNFTVLDSGMMIFIEQLNSGIYPDALVVCDKAEFYKGNQSILVNPLLIVEVLSKSTHSYDRKGKFEYYKTLPSFKEYLLIEQNKVSVETRFRSEPNTWCETQVEDLTCEIFLESLGLSISLASIYKRVPGISL